MPFITCPHCHVRSYATRGEHGVMPCPRCGAPLGLPAVDDVGDAARLLERTLDATREVIGLDVAVLTEVVGDQEVIRTGSGRWPGVDRIGGQALPIEDTICRRLLDGLIDGVVGDVASDERVSDLLGPAVFGVRAYLGVRVPVETDRIFVLCCMAPAPRPGLGLSDRRALEGLARSVAVQLAHALRDREQPWSDQ